MRVDVIGDAVEAMPMYDALVHIEEGGWGVAPKAVYYMPDDYILNPSIVKQYATAAEALGVSVKERK